ncbi:hypothetical protein PSPPH_1817 [Pseudomonas savastanoi pv. phaseolicola 1448A]|uniref:Uncharacterized protein n=1 Tax=Pseudomonas savastanoi pv. phaseolicola (strain 1448A / Race 6) TaxID=264730 RepID=Q48KM5_PSE14|nr:hypothetical protein PSPPH_1817 [Pseudomonas savastanoi pv. phaseolicola 1448A]
MQICLPRGLHAIFCKERAAFEWDVAYLKVR